MNAARCREGSWLSSHFPPRRRAAQAAIANGSRECAPDDKLRVVRRFVKEWRIMLLIRLGLAAMGLFLASDDASHVNGQAIPVDGGLTASMPYAGKPI